jgi:hypothetical protein
VTSVRRIGTEMQIKITERQPVFSPDAGKRIRNNIAYGLPVSEMPDMESGPPSDITVIPFEDVSDYAPDITVEGITEMDAISAYPPELIRKYKKPIRNSTPISNNSSSASWIWLSVRCIKCQRYGSDSFIGETGICYYCRNGIL